MLNKNVAEYTNFDGRTNKKIVQAPGGASSFSLAWDGDKTDYGPERKIKREQPQQGYQNYQGGNQNAPMYSEPMKVMETPSYGHGRGQVSQGYGQEKRMGGQYGYNGYSNPRQNTQGGYGNSTPTNPGNYGGYKNVPAQQLDIALEQQISMKNQRPPSVPQSKVQNEGRSSIKINLPQSKNLVFGGNQYNYWKEDSGTSQNKLESDKRIAYQQPPQQRQQSYGMVTGNSQKTSVKVHNPPGGKQSFSLG